MTYNNGPKITTDGLVMALDVANGKSFRGEPTINEKTNLLTSEVTPSQNYTLTSFNWVDISDTPAGVWKPRALTVRMNSGGANGKQWYWINQGNYIGKTITFSWFAKLISGSSTTDTICIAEGGYSSGNTVTTYTVTPEWRRVSVTRNITTSNSITLGSAENLFPLDTTIAYTGFQLEEKPYATPIVSGTRGTTVATGGGWADLAGNSNHGELVNGPVYNSLNGGSLVFDGINDGVQLPGTNLSLNQMTISSWNFSTNYNQNGFMFEKTTNGTVNTQYSLFYSSGDNSIYYRTYGLSTTDLTINTTSAGVVNNQWNNVVATWDGLNKRIYVNGNLVATSAALTGTVTQNTTGPAYIGIYGNFAGYPFNGRIAMTQLYNRALGTQEVVQNFNALRGRFGV